MSAKATTRIPVCRCLKPKWDYWKMSQGDITFSTGYCAEYKGYSEGRFEWQMCDFYEEYIHVEPVGLGGWLKVSTTLEYNGSPVEGYVCGEQLDTDGDGTFGGSFLLRLPDDSGWLLGFGAECECGYGLR